MEEHDCHRPATPTPENVTVDTTAASEYQAFDTSKEASPMEHHLALSPLPPPTSLPGLWASQIEAHLVPLEHLLDQWASACAQTPMLAEESLRLLGASPSFSRQTLLESISKLTASGVPMQQFNSYYQSSPWLPASPPESALTEPFPPTAEAATAMHYTPYQDPAPVEPSPSRMRSFSQPMPEAKSYPNGLLSRSVRSAVQRPINISGSSTASMSFSQGSRSRSNSVLMKPLSRCATPSSFHIKHRSDSLPSLAIPSLPATSSTTFLPSPDQSSPNIVRNDREYFVLHDRDLQARFPNDALEKSVQTLELVEKTAGSPDVNGNPTTFLTFCPVDAFPRSGSPVYLAVLNADVLTTLTPDGRHRSPHLSIFRFAPGDFIVAPACTLGSSQWWRHQICNGPHPSTGGGIWSARTDTQNARRRARILGHFATCMLGDVPLSLKAFATSLKSATEDRRDCAISGSD